MLKRKIIAIALILQKVLFANGQSALIWTQKGSDLEGRNSGDRSGSSVALSSDGKTVAIGAPNHNGYGQNSGLVQVYEYVGSSWGHKGKDLYGGSGDKIGRSVALSSDGSVVAIGAPYSFSSEGYVRILDFIDKEWVPKGSDIYGEGFGEFGSSVDLSADGSVVAISCPFSDRYIPGGGYVRILEFIDNTWKKKRSFSGKEKLDSCGISMALSADGDTVAISFSTYSRVYEYNNENNQFHQKGQDLERATSLAISADGSVVAVGNNVNSGHHGEKSGNVKVYKFDISNWIQRGENLDGDKEDDRFGIAVALSADGEKIAIGDRLHSGNVPQSGHVKIFQFDKKLWVQTGDDIFGQFTGEQFGRAVAVSADANIVAIGAPQHENGRVRVYEIPHEIHPPIGEAQVTRTDCVNDNQFCYHVEHNLNKRSTEESYAILKAEGCVEDIDNAAIQLSSFQYSEDEKLFFFEITLYPNRFKNSGVFTLNDDDIGTVKFCTKVMIKKKVQQIDYNIYSRRFEYLVKYDMKGNFVTTFQTIDDDEAGGVETDIGTFDVNACVCENDGSCIDNPPDIIQNSYIKICLKPSDTSVKISSFNMNFKNQDSSLIYPVIDSEVESSWTVVDKEFTSVNVIQPNFLIIKTYAIYELFQMGSTNDLTASGDVIFSFFDNSRRASTISSFALNLPVASNAVGEEGCIGKVTKKMRNLFFE